MVVGLTGGIGSGKTTILKEFQKFNNVAVYIADIEAKLLMNTSKKIKTQIITHFSSKAYNNQQLNRQFLSDIVFNDKDKLALLNAIVHPVVAAHFKSFCEQNVAKSYIIYENAILFESKSDERCDKIITVTAPKKVRIKRVSNRDKITEKEVEARINNQWNDNKKTLQSHYVIENIILQEAILSVAKINQALLKSLSLPTS